MSNPPKKKGTSAETELKARFEAAGFVDAARTSPGLPFDVNVPGRLPRQVGALATRPDRGRWLVTITLDDFLDLLRYRGYGARVESKRYARFALHSIFEKKFGR